MKRIDLFPSLRKAQRVLKREEMRGHVFVVPNRFLFNYLGTGPGQFLENQGLLRTMGRTSAGWETTHLHQTAKFLLRLRRDGASMLLVNSPYRGWVGGPGGTLDLSAPSPSPSPEIIGNLMRNLNNPSSVLTERDKYSLIGKFLLENKDSSARDFMNASQMLLWMGLPLHVPNRIVDDPVEMEYFPIQRMVASLPNSSMIGQIQPQIQFGIDSCTSFSRVHDTNVKVLSLRDVEKMEGLTREQIQELFWLDQLLESFPYCKVGQTEMNRLVAEARKEKRSMLPEILQMVPFAIFNHLQKIKKKYPNQSPVIEGEFVEGDRLASAAEFRAKMIEQVSGLDEFPETLDLLEECFEKMADLPPSWKMQWDFANQNWKGSQGKI